MAGGRPKSSADDSGVIADINVTPFVDVVLVLLVIFMITAPAFLKDRIGIQLPKTQTADSQKPPETIGIAINRDGKMLWNGVPISPEDLKREAEAAVKKNADVQALLSADGESKHSDLVRAMDLLKSAGLNRFAVQVQREEAAKTK